MKQKRLVLTALTTMLLAVLALVLTGRPAFATEGDGLVAAPTEESLPPEGADTSLLPGATLLPDATDATPLPEAADTALPPEATDTALLPEGTDAALLPEATDATPAKAERTIMLYLCGADLETYSGLASHNLRQILGASFSKDERVRFLVMTGGAEEWFLEKDYLYDPQAQSAPDGIDPSRNQIWEAKGVDAAENPSKLVLLDDGPAFEPIQLYDEESEEYATVGYEGLMTDPATLRYFVDYCAQHYPAEKYDLILWDHGGGPVDSYGADYREETPSTMRLDALVTALADNEVTKDGGRFDLINFDACLMGSTEVTLALAGYTDYYLCSAENVPGYGEEYSGWLGLLGEDPTVDTSTLGKRIVDDFLRYYNESNEMDSTTAGTFALIDTRKLLESGFLDDLNELVGLLSRAAHESDSSTGEILIYDELRSGRGALQYGQTFYRDLGNLVSQLAVSFYELTADDVVDDAELDMASEYQGVARRIGAVLANKDIIYAGATDTMPTSKRALYWSADETVERGALSSSGLHIFCPGPKSHSDLLNDYGPQMERAIDVLAEDGRIADKSLDFLRAYRDVMYDYAIVANTAHTVRNMINIEGMGRDDITFETFKKYLLTPGLEELPYFNDWNNVIVALLKRVWFIEGEEVDAYPDLPPATQDWLDRLVRQHAAEAISKDDITSANIVQQTGIGRRVRIQNTRQRLVQSVNANVLAELPAAEAFFAKEENQGYLGYFTDGDGSLQLDLGTIEGSLDMFLAASDEGLDAQALAEARELTAASDSFLADYVNGFNSSTTSYWNLDAFEEKWYAIRDAEGKLHVADCNPNEDPLLLVTYQKEGVDEPQPLLLGFAQNADGVFTLRDLYFVNEESGLRPIPVSELKGELTVTSSKLVKPFPTIRLLVPISQSTFTISAANASAIQIAYEDISKLEDIADTTGDGSSLIWQYVVKDIYDGECDITAQVEAAEDGTFYDIRLATVERATYNGKRQTPTLTYDGTVLKEGVDYAWSVTHDQDDLTSVGEHFVDLIGLGKFTDVALAAPFYIDPAPISEATVAGIEDKTYTGQAIEQALTLSFGGATLKEGVDYDLAYRDNVEVGTATITITGKGNFTGETTLTFQIRKADAAPTDGESSGKPGADSSKPGPTAPAPTTLPRTSDLSGSQPWAILATSALLMLASALILRCRAH